MELKSTPAEEKILSLLLDLYADQCGGGSPAKSRAGRPRKVNPMFKNYFGPDKVPDDAREAKAQMIVGGLAGLLALGSIFAICAAWAAEAI